LNWIFLPKKKEYRKEENLGEPFPSAFSTYLSKTTPLIFL